MVGFANVTYFSTCFKAEFGESYKKFEDKSITNPERTCLESSVSEDCG
jgi:AraC-like DNA-binding protein